MNEDIVYAPTPISEKPEKDGRYMVYDTNNGPAYWSTKRYSAYTDSWLDDSGDCFHPTHYLKPVSKQEFVREIAKAAWEASDNYYWNDSFGPIPNKYPDLETYLSNL